VGGGIADNRWLPPTAIIEIFESQVKSAMSTVTPFSTFVPVYVDELVAHVGDIPGSRIRLKPAPGTATESDLIHACDHENRLCELIDGVLVEKTVGAIESYLNLLLSQFLTQYVRDNNLGITLGPDGMLRYTKRKIYLPDISFISWSQSPIAEIKKQPIADLHPDLAIEVLSPSNSANEMQKKRNDYFDWGVQLVWELDPTAREMRVYTAPETFTTIDINGTLDGGHVLPGFSLPLQTLFADLDRQ
jgi:Uma2 family endonuclease